MLSIFLLLAQADAMSHNLDTLVNLQNLLSFYLYNVDEVTNTVMLQEILGDELILQYNRNHSSFCSEPLKQMIHNGNISLICSWAHMYTLSQYLVLLLTFIDRAVQ